MFSDISFCLVIFMRFYGDHFIEIKMFCSSDGNRTQTIVIPTIMKMALAVNGRCFFKKLVAGVEIFNKLSQTLFWDSVRIRLFWCYNLSLNMFVKFPKRKVQEYHPIAVFSGIISIRSSLPWLKIGIVANDYICSFFRSATKFSIFR